MPRPTRLALMSLSLLVLGIPMLATAVAGEEHQRPQARPEGRAEGRPGPNMARPGEGRPRGEMRPGGGAGPARPSFDGRGQMLDQRYNHGRYYPRSGTVYNSLPPGYRPYYYRGRERYYFNGGIWYAPRGPGFVVVQPPPGIVISVLPPYYSTVWISGSPYYYADNVYYTWQPEQNGYAVVDPPDNADQPTTPPEGAAGGAEDLIVYPKDGQSKEQQAADQFECHSWARGQSGFDPTEAGGGVQTNDADRSRANYNRAMSACLQGRGYQVN